MTYYEIYCDESNYHLWAIRKKGVTSFAETMHAVTKGDAEQIAAELDRLQEKVNALLTKVSEANTERDLAKTTVSALKIELGRLNERAM